MLERTVLPVGHNERGPVGAQGLLQLLVELFHVFLVQVDPGLAVGPHVQLDAVERQQRGPAAVHRPVGVVDLGDGARVGLAAVEVPVAIRVGPEQKPGRHAADQQQLLDRFQRPVLGGVRRIERGVVVDFGAVFARLVVGVDPVEDGVGDVLGHPRQAHQDLPAAVFDVLVGQRQGVEV